MKYILYFPLYFLFSILFCIPNILLSQTFKGEAQKSNSSLIEKQLLSWEIYQIDATAISAAVNSQGASAQVTLDLGSHHWKLILESSRLLLGQYFIQVQHDKSIEHYPRSTVSAYKGYDALSGGQVRLTLDNDFIYGYIEDGMERYYIEPLHYFDPAAAPDLFIVYAKSAVNRSTYTSSCAVIEAAEKLENITPNLKKPNDSPESIGCYQVEIAVASDQSMYNKYGSVSAVINHNAGVLNNVEGDYTNVFNQNIEFMIVTQFVSTGSDPWSTSTNAATLLNSFATWGQAGNFGVTFDLGELWTDRDFQTTHYGISYQNGFCNSTKYHCLQDFTSNAELLRCLASHQIGHNFGGLHDVCPPDYIMCPSISVSTGWSNQSITAINTNITQLISSGCISACASVPLVADFDWTPIPACSSQSVQFSDQSSGDISSRSWTFAGGAPSSSTQVNPVVIWNAPGTYNVTLTLNGTGGPVSITHPITISTSPSVNLGPDGSLCAASSLTLNAGNPGSTFLWSTGATSQTISVNSAGTFSVTVTSGGCSSNDMVVFSQTPAISVSNFTFTNLSGSFTVSGGLPQMNGSNYGSVTMTLVNSPGTTATLTTAPFTHNETVNFTAPQPGIYEIVLSDNAGCTRLQQVLIPIPGNGTCTNLWETQNSGTPNNLESVFFTGYLNGWAVGSNGTICSTINSGQTWNADNSVTPNALYDVSFFNSQTGWVVGASSTILKTTNGGQSWTPQTLGQTVLLKAVTFINSQTGWVAGATGKVGITTNGGSGWTVVGTGTSNTLEDICFINSQIGWVVGDLGTIRKSTDGGLSWSPQVSGTTQLLSDVYFLNTQTGWAVGQNGTLLKTTNGGSSWLPQNANTTKHLTSVHFVDSQTGWIAGQDGLIKISTNGGANWSVQTSGTPNMITSLYFVNSTRGWASGANGTILRFGPATPTCEALAQPVPNSTNVPTNTALSWPVASGCFDGYSLRIGTTPNGADLYNGIIYEPDFQPPQPLPAGSTIYVRLIPIGLLFLDLDGDGIYETVINSGNLGDTSFCQEYSFTTFSCTNTQAAAGPDVTVCNGSSILLSASGGVSYQWSGPGNFTSTLQNPVRNFTTTAMSGTYQVTVTNNLGCTGTASMQVTVQPAMKITDISSAGLSGSFILSGGLPSINGNNYASVTMTLESDPNITATLTTAPFTHGETVSFTCPQDGTYLIVVTDADGCTGTHALNLSGASITVDLTTPEMLVNTLFAPQIIPVCNVSFSGSSAQGAIFGNAASSIGINDGLLLATGEASVACGPNDNSGASGGFTMATPDIEIQQLIGSNLTVFDLAKLEFDFVATDTVLNLEMVFGSEEYCEYASSPILGYDGAGVFISGPGITSNSQSGLNLALVPGTNLPLTVKNINHATNNAYYVNNQEDDPACSPYLVAAAPLAIQYDGFTTVLKPSVPLQVHQTYHLTFKIADIGDGIYDSGLFLKADMKNAVPYCVSGLIQPLNLATNVPVNTNIQWQAVSGCADYHISLSTTPGGTNLYNNIAIGNATSWQPPQPLPAGQIIYVRITPYNALGSATGCLEFHFTTAGAPCPISAGFNWTTNVQTVTFTNTSSNATTYAWDFGDGSTSSQTAPVHTYLSGGFYTVTLIANSPCGADTITHLLNTAPSAGFSADPPAGCAALMVQFTNESSANATSFQWTFPGGIPSASNQPNPVVIYQNTGTYSATLTATNSVGSTAFTLSNFVTVQNVPTPGFTYSTNGLTVNFTNTSLNGASYSWDFGDGGFSSLQNPSHTYGSNGSYTVSLTVSNVCGSTVATNVISISQASVPDAAFYASPLNGCSPLTVYYINQSAGSPTTYQWTFPGGSPATSSLQNPIVIYSTPGLYSATLIALNANGADTLVKTNYVTVGILNATVSPDQVVCSGESVSLQAGGGLNYQWSGAGPAAAQWTFVPLASGTYTVTVTDGSGCTAVKSVSVSMLPPIAVSGFQATGLSGSFVLTGGLPQADGSNYISVSMFLQSNPGVMATLTTAPYSHNETVNFTAPQAGIYKIELTDGNGCTGSKIVLISDGTGVQDTLPPCIEWLKSLGGSGYESGTYIEPTNDGGFVVTGHTESSDGDVSSNHGGRDVWVVKLNATGNLDWQKTLGGSSDESASCIQQTNDGGFLVAGYAHSNDGDVSGNHGNEDIWIVKLDVVGTLQWQKTLGGSYNDAATALQQTADGGIIICGTTQSYNGDVTGNHGGADFWVIKLDAGGNLLWQKALGGNNSDNANSIRQSSDGGYIVTGSSYSNDGEVTGNHGNFDFWVVKLDGTGNILWQKTLGGSASDEAQSIQQTYDGGFIIAGRTSSGDGDITGYHGNEDAWVVKLDDTGNIQWQKTLGGSADDYALSIQQGSDGGFFVTGGTLSNDIDMSGNHGGIDAWVIKLNTLGEIAWNKSIGGSNHEVTKIVQETNDGGLILSGNTMSNDGDVFGNHGVADIWAIKLKDCCTNSSTTLSLSTGTQTICPGQPFSLPLTISGGNGPYNLLYNNGLSDIELSNIGAAYNLNLSPSGTTTYTFKSIKDVNGCLTPLNGQSFVLTVDPVLNFATDVTPAGCGLLVGAIALNISGGTPPYQYNWQDLPSPNDPEDRIGLAAGTYTATVTDVNNCTVTVSVNVAGGPAPLAQLTISENSGVPNDLLVCAGDGAIFTAGGGSEYRFSVNGVPQSLNYTTDNILSLSALTTNTTVKVSARYSAACEDSTAAGEGFGLEPITLSVSPLVNLGPFYMSLEPACPGGAVQVILHVPDVPDGPDTVQYNINNGIVHTVTINFNAGIGILPLGVLPSQSGTVCEVLQIGNYGVCGGIPMAGGALVFDVQPAIEATIDTTICALQAITINGHIYNQPGTYIDTLKTAANCDSILTLHLNTVSQFDKSVTANFCTGGSYFFYGNTLTQPGDYEAVSPGSFGCDTLVHLKLSENPPVFNFLNASICPGASYPVGDSSFTSPGLHEVLLQSVFGCDSTVKLTLQVWPLKLSFPNTLETICNPDNVTLTPDIQFCPNCEYQWSNGSTQFSIDVAPNVTTDYSLTISDSNGCTLTETVSVEVHDRFEMDHEMVLCPNDSISSDGMILTEPGTYDLHLKTVFGCDSLVHLTLYDFDPSQLAAMPDTVLLPPEDFPHLDFSVTENDLLGINHLLNIALEPSQGKVDILSNDVLRYTLTNPDFYGIDSLLYAICPVSDCPETCDSAWVFVQTQPGTLEKIKKFIPNLITPHPDGFNDFFDPVQVLLDHHLEIEQSELFMINRWGETVFYQQRGAGEGNAWTGDQEGRPLPEGTYYYRLRVVSGVEYWLKGPVNLLR